MPRPNELLPASPSEAGGNKIRSIDDLLSHDESRRLDNDLREYSRLRHAADAASEQLKFC